MKRNIYGISAMLLVIGLIVSSITGYYFSCQKVREGVLRLHITANSDSEADQNVKLKVRDAILEKGFDIFDGSVTADEAKTKITPYLGELERTADEVLKENGFGYGARAYIVYEYFDTRDYDGVTLPAGNYTALRIALGTGEGKNWWCVMFPPLCLPAVTQNRDDAFAVFSGEGTRVVEAKDGYAVKFRIVEVIEDVIQRIREK